MTNQIKSQQARIPHSTYRLQLNKYFTLKDATELVDYLQALGISDCYTSSLLASRPGSLHGYDVTDHTKINPEIGTEEEFIEFASNLRKRNMGIIMDVVPNHMCVAGSANPWWNDVLENGPSSPYASFFDIDWLPPKRDLASKVLLPVLGDQYGIVLENQEIQIAYEQGAFFADYYEIRLPIAPRIYTQILEPVVEDMKLQLGEYDPHILELESIITGLTHLPTRSETDSEKIRERMREKEIIKRRLWTLTEANADINRSIIDTVQKFNGVRGNPRSFDRLETLLTSQAYRLAFWQVAADEINYRRFFDINDLAAIRVEDPAVFTAVHQLIFRLMKEGWITGLRIDHVDGLFDPQSYFLDIQREAVADSAEKYLYAGASSSSGLTQSGGHNESGKPCYIVVEKIFGQDERLRPDWAVYGTTGYGFMNLLNGVLIDTASHQHFLRIYERFIGEAQNFDDLVYECKKLILRVAMSSELHVLARRLDRISEQHRYSRDFTLNSQQYALEEVIACFPVYRTYIRSNQSRVSDEDRRYILAAIRAAKRRNPATSPSIFDFIASILLLEDPEGLSSEGRADRRDFVMRFQQLTGPITAKGIEDTAFYRFHPLASLNEVGGDPQLFGVSVDFFHRQNEQRLQNTPHGLSATSTHDTKRSEDVRVRINALSEIPAHWYRAITRWRRLNRDLKISFDQTEIPDESEEYLLYQTLLGTWPLDPMNEEENAAFTERIEAYMIKAMREAKIHSSWISPNEDHERGMRNFIRALLEPRTDNRFLRDFIRFQATVARAGMFSSLSQTLLKIASPGVPDFYQGNEVWNFNLVDPDNRRPVDFAHRQQMLASLNEDKNTDLTVVIDNLLKTPEDGRIKLYVTSRALNFRRDHAELFAEGSYLPLEATGERQNNVIAFARKRGNEAALIVAARFFTRLGSASQLPVGSRVWGDTAVAIKGRPKAKSYRDIFTGEIIDIDNSEDGGKLRLKDVFAHLPLALLEPVV